MCRAYTKPLGGGAAGGDAAADDFGQILDDFALYGLEGDAVLPKAESGESFSAGVSGERFSLVVAEPEKKTEKAFPRGFLRATTPSPARRPAREPVTDRP